MRIVKFLLSLLSCCVVSAAFFGVPFAYVATWYQAGPAAVAAFSSEPLACLPICVILVLTLLFGRIFCETMCPLGFVQTVLHFVTHPKSSVRRVCTRLPQTRTQRFVRWGIVLVSLVPVPFLLVQFVEPYAIWGKALTLVWSGLAVLGVVLMLACVGKGRVWCNWICPVGTVITAFGRFAPFGNRVGKGCGNCRACFRVDASSSPRFSATSSDATRREVLQGVAAVAVAEKVTDGGFAPVSLPTHDAARRPVLPPGFGSRTAFSRKCIACGLCMANCPEKILKPSTRLSSWGQPQLDFRFGYCLPTCVKCGTVCPTDAIAPLQADTKRDSHVGRAVWKKSLCLRTTSSDACTACVRKCPVQAIHLVAGFPVVDAVACVGCGACEHVCPVRPVTAIAVEGFEEERRVRPMSGEDLMREMRALVASGVSVVVAHEGVIRAQEGGRGIAPLLNLLDTGMLQRGAWVCDKVVGRAAAAICVQAGVQRVHALLMSEGAASFLTAHGVQVSADKKVAQILNHERTGLCPMEKAVEKFSSPDEMVAAIRRTLEELRKAKQK